MNRIQKMNQIRSICGYEPVKRAFFYRDEIVEIVETIQDRELSETEETMSVKELVSCFFPEWKKQSTAVTHSSVHNLDYILELLEDANLEEDTKSDEDANLEEDTKSVTLLDLLQGLNDQFSHNILSVSVCANDPKQFTITLK